MAAEGLVALVIATTGAGSFTRGRIAGPIAASFHCLVLNRVRIGFAFLLQKLMDRVPDFLERFLEIDETG